MAAQSLLQALLVTVIVGIVIAQNVRQPVHFPNAAVRTRERPNCARNSVDPSAPCERDGDYNDNVRFFVKRLLQQSNSINAIVNNPILSSIFKDTLAPVPGQDDIATRFGGPEDVAETTVCAARRERIFPQRAKTLKGDWAFVVNQDNVEQALTFEKCFKEGQPCDLDVSSNRAFATVCRQKYVYRSLLTVSENTLGPEKVLMPSCCVCYRRRRFDISVRSPFDSRTDNTRQPAVMPPSSLRNDAPLSFDATQGNRGSTTGSNIHHRSSSPQRFSGHQPSPFNPHYHPSGGR